MYLKTAELKAGDVVRLNSFGKTDKAYRKQLVAFGVTPSFHVRVVRFAPLGSPVQLDVGGASIMLRTEEAAELLWERV